MVMDDELESAGWEKKRMDGEDDDEEQWSAVDFRRSSAGRGDLQGVAHTTAGKRSRARSGRND
jgi:hypothetical protein